MQSIEINGLQIGKADAVSPVDEGNTSAFSVVRGVALSYFVE
jgi:hypothetical protein